MTNNLVVQILLSTFIGLVFLIRGCLILAAIALFFMSLFPWPAWFAVFKLNLPLWASTFGLIIYIIWMLCVFGFLNTLDDD